MSKVLFFNIPAYGHTYPTLPLVGELLQRGEQVIYSRSPRLVAVGSRHYSSPSFQQAIEQTGAIFHNSESPFLNDDTQIDENMVRVAYMLLQASQAELEGLLPQAREEAPDYIIHDGLCPWGKCIAQILGVPAICSMTTFAIPPISVKNFLQVIRDPGNMRLLFSTTIAQMLFEGREELIPFYTLSNQLHKKYRIARPQISDMFTNRSMMNIVYAKKHFQPFAEVFDDTFKFVGPSIVARSDIATNSIVAHVETHVIYISMGTVFNDKAHFYRLCYEAFADMDSTIVLSVGKKTNIATLGTIPRNFIVQEFVPQLELLQRTALFITHGGMNSVSEALYYSVPLIVIPQSADQNLVSQRIEQLGAGKALRREGLTAQKLRSTAEDVLANPAYQQASARLGHSFGEPDGFMRAAHIPRKMHGILLKSFF